METHAATTDIDRSQAGTLRELLRVAIPLVISYGAAALQYVVDRIYLSWDSVDSMAASLPAGVLHWNLAALGLGTVTYANAFIGQYVGAREPGRVGPVLWQAIYLSLLGGALILCCVPLGPTVFNWFGHDAGLQALELRYYNIMCYGTAPLLVSNALACFYTGRGQTKVVMIVNILATLVNVVLDYALIFGKWGFPRMGIDGAALATVIAFASVGLMYVVHMVWTQQNSKYGLWSGRRFDRELFARLVRFGLPSGLQQFLDIACFTVFIQLVGSLGKEQLSATSLVFNLNGLVFVPMLGLGMAVTALVGQRIGEGRPQLAVRTTWLAFAVASAYVFSFCYVYLFAPKLILTPYGISQDHPELEATVIHLLRFVSIYAVFDAMVVVFSSAIRGAGDTRFAMIMSFSLGLLLLVLPTYVGTQLGTAAFTVAWYSVTVFIVVLGLAFVARFQQGRWKTMRVIEHTAAELPPEEADVEGLAPVALERAVS